jgi:hypothetical protein
METYVLAFLISIVITFIFKQIIGYFAKGVNNGAKSITEKWIKSKKTGKVKKVSRRQSLDE